MTTINSAATIQTTKHGRRYLWTLSHDGVIRRQPVNPDGPEIQVGTTCVINRDGLLAVAFLAGHTVAEDR